jgi:hypothetical protein
MGWDNKEIIQKLCEDVEWIPYSVKVGTYNIFIYSIGSSTNTLMLNGGDGYKASLINSFERKQAIFISKIEKKMYNRNLSKFKTFQNIYWNNT